MTIYIKKAKKKVHIIGWPMGRVWPRRGLGVSEEGNVFFSFQNIYYWVEFG